MGRPPAWGAPVSPEGNTPTRQTGGVGEPLDCPGGRGGAPWWGQRPGMGIDMGGGFGGPGGPGDPLNVVGFREVAGVVSGSVFLERTSQEWMWVH